MAKYKIPDDVKRRIVIELANFSTTNEIRDMLKLEYGLEMDLQDIIRYDATKSYCVVGETLKALFHETREAYCKGSADLFIAEKVFRMRRLQVMALKAEKQGNLKLAADLYRQAAEEVGNVHTNERVIKGKLSVNVEEQPSIEEMRNLLADRIAEAFETDPIQPTAPGTATTQ